MPRAGPGQRRPRQLVGVAAPGASHVRTSRRRGPDRRRRAPRRHLLLQPGRIELRLRVDPVRGQSSRHGAPEDEPPEAPRVIARGEQGDGSAGGHADDRAVRDPDRVEQVDVHRRLLVERRSRGQRCLSVPRARHRDHLVGRQRLGQPGVQPIAAAEIRNRARPARPGPLRHARSRRARHRARAPAGSCAHAPVPAVSSRDRPRRRRDHGADGRHDRQVHARHHGGPVLVAPPFPGMPMSARHTGAATL